MSKLADAFKKGISKVKSANPVAAGAEIAGALKAKIDARKMMTRARDKQNPDQAFPQDEAMAKYGIWEKGYGEGRGGIGRFDASDISDSEKRSYFGKPDASAPDAGPYDRAMRATSTKKK